MGTCRFVDTSLKFFIGGRFWVFQCTDRAYEFVAASILYPYKRGSRIHFLLLVFAVFTVFGFQAPESFHPGLLSINMLSISVPHTGTKIQAIVIAVFLRVSPCRGYGEWRGNSHRIWREPSNMTRVKETRLKGAEGWRTVCCSLSVPVSHRDG